MDKYTIYCTEEQTKKALELGAPYSSRKEATLAAIDDALEYLANKN